MPWKETDKMDQVRQFISAMLKGEKPFKHICADFGISEKTGYKWKNRFYESGWNNLGELSRRPKNSPAKLDSEVLAELVRIKNAHDAWGPKKILAIYKTAHPDRDVPCLSCVEKHFKIAGLVKTRNIRTVTTTNCPRLQQPVEAKAPNDVWCIDFKGYWMSGGEKCEPFTIRDLCSKKMLRVQLVTSKDSETVREIMQSAFREFGLPKTIHSDNGAPFACSNGVLGLTSLSVWWISLGIIPNRSRKGCPGQNGSLERFHADIAAEIENKIHGGIEANQRALDEWVKEYNSVRPNEAIGMRTPDDIYLKSERKYTGDYDEIEYPIGFLRRKVNKGGAIKVHGIAIRIGYAFKGYHLGLKPVVDANGECTYDVFLADFLLGKLDITTGCFNPLNEVE